MYKKNYSKKDNNNDKEFEVYQQKLIEGINNVLSSYKWKDYLNLQSKFYKYSFNNVMLILEQYPMSTSIMAESKWNELGRTIKKGEKPIKVYAPLFRKYSNKPKFSTEGIEVGDYINVKGSICKTIYSKGSYGIYMLQIEEINGIPKSGYINISGDIADNIKLKKAYKLSGEVSKYKGLKQLKVTSDEIKEVSLVSSYTRNVLKGFMLVDTFDVAQTEGEDLPIGICEELKNNSENSLMLIESINAICDIPIIEEDITNGAKGYFSPSEQKIALKKGISNDQKAKTVVHEYSHYLINSQKIDLNSYLNDTEEYSGLRGAEEVVVESVAYIVCDKYGVDTSSYSFEYVTSWSGGDISKIKQLGGLIQKISGQVINKIEELNNRVSTENDEEEIA